MNCPCAKVFACGENACTAQKRRPTVWGRMSCCHLYCFDVPCRRGLRIVRDDVFFFKAKVIAHSLRRSSAWTHSSFKRYDLLSRLLHLFGHPVFHSDSETARPALLIRAILHAFTAVWPSPKYFCLIPLTFYSWSFQTGPASLGSGLGPPLRGGFLAGIRSCIFFINTWQMDKGRSIEQFS